MDEERGTGEKVLYKGGVRERKIGVWEGNGLETAATCGHSFTTLFVFVLEN